MYLLAELFLCVSVFLIRNLPYYIGDAAISSHIDIYKYTLCSAEYWSTWEEARKEKEKKNETEP